MCNEETITFITLACVFLNSVFEFCVGVSEAVFLSQYSSLSDGCQDIWKWILAACIFNIIIPVFTCCGLSKYVMKDGSLDIGHLARIGVFIVGIWSAIVYYNITSSCYDFWQTSAPQLYTFVMIHFVCLWISVGLCAIIILLLFAMCCGLIATGKTNTVTVHIPSERNVV